MINTEMLKNKRRLLKLSILSFLFAQFSFAQVCTKNSGKNSLAKIEFPNPAKNISSPSNKAIAGQVSQGCEAKILRNNTLLEAQGAIHYGDVLQTKNSNCELVVILNSGAELRLAGNSRLVIDPHSTSPTEANSFFANLLFGSLRLFTHGPLKSEIKTPIMTIGIRGTAYELSHRFDKNNHPVSEVVVLQGEVYLRHSQKNQFLTLRKGQSAIANEQSINISHRSF